MFFCDICGKSYKYRQSLKKHITIHIESLKCIYCKREYKFKKNLKKHERICKENPDVLALIEHTIKLEQLKNEDIIGNFDNKVSNQVNSQNTNSNNTNISNNNNNNTNNNINIITLGNESLSDILSNSEQIKILNQKYNCLEYIIKYIHFNNKFPQFQNILIDDIKSNKGYIYDENVDDFRIMKKGELIDNIIENRLNDIEEFCQINSKSLRQNTRNIITKFVTGVVDEYEKPKSNYLKELKEDIDILMYNERKLIKDNHKTLKKLRLKTKITK
jgi:hypothetical protein